MVPPRCLFPRSRRSIGASRIWTQHDPPPRRGDRRWHRCPPRHPRRPYPPVRVGSLTARECRQPRQHHVIPKPPRRLYKRALLSNSKPWPTTLLPCCTHCQKRCRIAFLDPSGSSETRIAYGTASGWDVVPDISIERVRLRAVQRGTREPTYGRRGASRRGADGAFGPSLRRDQCPTRGGWPS